MLTSSPARAAGNQGAAVSRVRALAAILEEEFEIPFRFYDAEALELPEGAGAPSGDAWRPACESVRALLRGGKYRVEPLEDGRFELGMVFYQGREPGLAALGAIAGQGLRGPERERERRRLARWLQAVCDRIRLTEEAAAERRREKARDGQLSRAWSALLVLNDAIRQYRVHREPEAVLKFILRSLRSLLGAQAAVCFGRQGGDWLAEGGPVVPPEEAACLAGLLDRAARSLRPGEPILRNRGAADLFAERLPQISNLLAAPTHEAGWLVLLNKRHTEGRARHARKEGPPEADFHKDDAVTILPFASLLEAIVRGSRRYDELKEVFVGLTRSLVTAIDARDPYAQGQSERVARLAVEVGRELGLSGEELNDLYLAGLLHDVGKVGVRDAIIQKEGPLGPEDCEHVKRHVTIGHDLLRDLRPLRKLLPGVLHHHERYDGAGYPAGLAGEDVPLAARILAVADAYDAMSRPRPYREAMPPAEVEEKLRRGAGSQWDARVVAALLRRRPAPSARQGGDSLKRALEDALCSNAHDAGKR